MLAEKFCGQALIINGGIQYGVLRQNVGFTTVALQQHRFRSSPAKVYGQHLVPPFWTVIQKWQCHVRLLAGSEIVCKSHITVRAHFTPCTTTSVTALRKKTSNHWARCLVKLIPRRHFPVFPRFCAFFPLSNRA